MLGTGNHNNKAVLNGSISTRRSDHQRDAIARRRFGCRSGSGLVIVADGAEQAAVIVVPSPTTGARRELITVALKHRS